MSLATYHIRLRWSHYCCYFLQKKTLYFCFLIISNIRFVLCNLLFVVILHLIQRRREQKRKQNKVAVNQNALYDNKKKPIRVMIMTKWLHIWTFCQYANENFCFVFVFVKHTKHQLNSFECQCWFRTEWNEIQININADISDIHVLELTTITTNNLVTSTWKSEKLMF